MINTTKVAIILALPLLSGFFIGFKLAILLLVAIYAGVVYARYHGLMPKKDISGQHVMITGGGLGIGKELALQLVEFQCKISIAELSLENAQTTEKELKNKGCKNVAIFQCDVTNKERVDQVFKEAVEKFGDIDILINNAGIVSGKKMSQNDPKIMAKTVEVNTTAHFYTIKNVFNRMIERNKGHIVTLSSVAGFLPSAGLADYNASKYGALGIHESLTLELQAYKSDVQMTCICPWFVDTDMAKTVDGVAGIPKQGLSKTISRIITAIRQNEHIVVIPWTVNILIFIKQFLPFEVMMLLTSNSLEKAVKDVELKNQQLEKKDN